MTTQTVLIGSLTIPGRPECLSAARKFVAQALGGGDWADTAVLLASELLTNSLQHSASGRPGGLITITLIQIPGGVRAEVADAGSPTVPAVRPALAGPPEPAENGHGLQLVDSISHRWGHTCDHTGATTWFELDETTMNGNQG